MMKSAVWFIFLFTVFSVLTVFLYGDQIHQLHQNGDIYWISSDGAQYLKNHLVDLKGVSFSDRPSLFLTAMPIFLFRAFGNDFTPVLMVNLLVLLGSILVLVSEFKKLESRLLFAAFAIAFPYAFFAPFSLNKEVFTVGAILMFLKYFSSGSWRYFILSVLLAFFARYYMVASILFLALAFPRNFKIRYWVIAAGFLFFSVAVKFKNLVPGYSIADENYYLNAGFLSSYFKFCTDLGFYWLIYIPKYVALMISKLWLLLISDDISIRRFDAIEIFVSFFSTVAFLLATSFVFARSSEKYRKLFIMGILAPMPFMWADIFHWRYYSFVYFIFLFALVYHYEKRSDLKEN